MKLVLVKPRQIFFVCDQLYRALARFSLTIQQKQVITKARSQIDIMHDHHDRPRLGPTLGKELLEQLGLKMKIEVINRLIHKHQFCLLCGQRGKLYPSPFAAGQ